MNESSRVWHTRVPSLSRTIGPSLCECTELSATTARNCHSRPPSVEAHTTTRWRRRQARRRGRIPSTSGSSRVPSGSCTSRRGWKPVTGIGCGSLQLRPPSVLRNRKVVPVLANPEAVISRVPSGSLSIRGIAQWQVDSSASTRRSPQVRPRSVLSRNTSRAQFPLECPAASRQTQIMRPSSLNATSAYAWYRSSSRSMVT